MPLSIQDALLVALVAGWVSVLVADDIRGTRFAGRPRLVAALAAWAKASLLPRTPALHRPAGERDALAHEPKPRGSSLALLPHVADVLVVDDSAVARAKLRRLFVEAGYEVHVASDGVAALDRLTTGRYSLMVTDLEMPNLDGIALIHECLRRPQTARMPIIAVSAHENLRAKFNECREVCGVHRKPWADDILLSHVATLISARGEARKLGGQRQRLAA